MKVLLVAHNASVEGAGIAFANICNGLALAGHDVIAVVPGHKGTYELISDSPNVRKVVISQIRNEVFPKSGSLRDKLMFMPRLARQLLWRPIFKKKLQKLVRDERPDIIHSNTGTLRIPALVATEENIPHVWHVRECQKQGYGFRPFGGEKKVETLFKGANNHTIAITRSVADYYHLSAPQNTVIYDGVFSGATVESRRNINPDKENVILYVGLLSEKKGVPMLLQAFDNICDRLPGYELHLAGNLQMNLDAVISETENPQRIKYLGFRKDIYELMSRARALVVPSEYEGFGFITAEAMLNHTLVIGRNTAGTKEQMDKALSLKGREAALRFSSLKELEQALIDAVDLGPADYKRLTDDAFDVVARSYTNEINVDNIINLYRRLLDNHERH